MTVHQVAWQGQPAASLCFTRGRAMLAFMPDVPQQPALSDDEWDEWYRLTPQDRWRQTQKLWAFYLEAGGSLDPEPDSQSPFNAAFTQRSAPSDGRPGLRVLRRSGV